MSGSSTSAIWAPHLGAVSLTFDDGDPSQLEKAIPSMDKHGLRGTFFLSPPNVQTPQAIAAWQTAAARGHEMANHTYTHPGSTHFGNGDGVENWTLDQIEQDILRAQKWLDGLFPHQQQWTYAYPCYQTDVGRGEIRQSYIPIVARHFLAGRGMGEWHFGNHPLGVDLAKVWATPVERLSGHDLIGIVEEQAATAGKWVVLAFHTIEGHRLSVAGEDFEMLVNHLARNRSRIWTDTFGAVAAKVAAAQSASALSMMSAR